MKALFKPEDPVHCHVCKGGMKRDKIRDKEWCQNPSCILYNHQFNTMFVPVEIKEIRTMERAVNEA